MRAVVVGRFQVQSLTEAHRALLDAASAHGDLWVVLGSTGGQPTESDPLDYSTRWVMLGREYVDCVVRELLDHPDNAEWSRRLDALVGPNATLFCGRDSFRKHYTGTLPVVEVPEVPSVSGTDARAAIGAPYDQVGRAGMVFAAKHRFPTSYQAVDVVILCDDEVLLGRKSGMTGWQFPGGFVDPSDGSLEESAIREVAEETGLTLGRSPFYVGSVRIDDYRYRKSRDKVMSAVFVARANPGHALRAGDDLEEVGWFAVNDVEGRLAESHRPIWALARGAI